MQSMRPRVINPGNGRLAGLGWLALAWLGLLARVQVWGSLDDCLLGELLAYIAKG